MRRALVVGGAGGLGGAVVRALLEGGVEVAVAGRSRPKDARVRHVHPVDAAAADWPALYEAVEREGGPLDAVVFVAGTGAFGRTARFPAARARELVELNFWGCTGAARAAAERWDAGGRPGTFLAVLSIVARRAVPFEAYYAASKAAAARFLECLDLEYAGKGIRCVAAFPGALATPFRSTAEWYGLEAPPPGGGSDPAETARAIVALLHGSRRARVIGWRERTIDLADRVAPGLYDRAVLRRRVARAR